MAIIAHSFRKVGTIVVSVLVLGGCAGSSTKLPPVEIDKFIHVCLPMVDYTSVQDQQFVQDLGKIDPNSSVIARIGDYHNMREADRKCLAGGGSGGAQP